MQSGLQILASFSVVFLISTYVIAIFNPSKPIYVNGRRKKHWLLPDSTGNYNKWLIAYPSNTSKEWLQQTISNMQLSPYPSNKSIIHENENCCHLITTYRKGRKLSELRDPDKTYHTCEILLRSLLKSRKTTRSLAAIPNIDVIFPKHLQVQIKNMLMFNQKAVIHGDLHPDNILISDGKFFVIDWDLSGTGPKWFDMLTLTSSPLLNLSIDQRLKLAAIIPNNFTENEFLEIFLYFTQFKQVQLNKCSESLKKTSKKYQNLSKKIDDLLAVRSKMCI